MLFFLLALVQFAPSVCSFRQRRRSAGSYCHSSPRLSSSEKLSSSFLRWKKPTSERRRLFHSCLRMSLDNFPAVNAAAVAFAVRQGFGTNAGRRITLWANQHHVRDMNRRLALEYPALRKTLGGASMALNEIDPFHEDAVASEKYPKNLSLFPAVFSAYHEDLVTFIRTPSHALKHFGRE